MRRPLQALAARVDRLAAEHLADGPAPEPDDPAFMAWVVKHYGLARLLAETSEHTDRDRPPARRRRA